uniref:Uncharacterized protein LOC105034228 isoform X1 n=1 Tax=Elaeis guineensis var. tenera TaxID=51953 RepID=A0A6J0PBB5_ELAGV|nr:uncharacterized protein LOC105034228 isoform X1 [Elaeis guineensis]XP_019702476.1 uncharacterized protein LOC105034228 isoform X1 [Elaeis guineensis]
MGISVIMGLKATVSLLAFYFLKDSGVTMIHIPLLHASLVDYLVAIASLPAVNLPLLLGKSSDGSFPLWSMLIFGPFLASARIFVFLRRLKSREPAYSKISEGLYVGAWPFSSDHVPPGEPAVIDCTCELPRSSVLSRNAYLCIGTWDTRAPHPSQIESAVRWACRKRALKKPVYIHCAFGHGRSVCIMCALLVALGLAEDWKSAEKMIREKRPFIHLNAFHRRSLEEWSKHRISSKRQRESEVSSVILSDYSRE